MWRKDLPIKGVYFIITNNYRVDYAFFDNNKWSDIWNRKEIENVLFWQPIIPYFPLSLDNKEFLINDALKILNNDERKKKLKKIKNYGK